MKKLFEKINRVYLSLGLAVMGMFSFGMTALAAPSSTPEEIIDSVAGGTLDGAIDLLNYVITNYLKYILVLGLVVALYGIFKRFAHIAK